MSNIKKSRFNLVFYIALFLSLSKCVLAADPVKAPWPSVFSQAFTLIVQSNTSGRISTAGVHWYNWNIKSMQLDYANSEVFHSCYQYIRTKTPCTIVYKNLEQSYIYFPQKRQCCYLGDTQSIPAPQDMVQDFSYNTTGKINEQTFYIWALNDQQEIINYYTTMNEKQITRRFYYPQVNTSYDYMLSSYSQKITNPSIFTIPNYCNKDKPCSNSDQKKKQKIFVNGLFYKTSKKNKRMIQN